jgi:hypothetical protein
MERAATDNADASIVKVVKEAKRTMMNADGTDQVCGNEVLELGLGVVKMPCTLKTQRFHPALYTTMVSLHLSRGVIC